MHSYSLKLENPPIFKAGDKNLGKELCADPDHLNTFQYIGI